MQYIKHTHRLHQISEKEKKIYHVNNISNSDTKFKNNNKKKKTNQIANYQRNIKKHTSLVFNIVRRSLESLKLCSKDEISDSNFSPRPVITKTKAPLTSPTLSRRNAAALVAPWSKHRRRHCSRR